MQRPDWSDLRIFLEVYRAGSLSGAGRTLGVHASTIGRRLDGLEVAMGTVLFQRTSEGLLATDAADEMFESVEIMERQVHLITQRTSGKSSALRGPVRLTTTPNLATHFLIERIRPFQERYPGIEVKILTSPGFTDLGRGEADIALRFTGEGHKPVPKAHEDVLVAKLVTRVGIGLYASRDYLHREGRPETSRDLAGHHLLRPSHDWVPGFQWVKKYGADARSLFSTDTIAGLAVAAAAGHGIAPLPSFMTFDRPELERIGPPSQVAAVNGWLIMPRDLRRVARVCALRDFLLELLGQWRVLLAGDE